MITRPSIVSRCLEVLYPERIERAQYSALVRQMALLDVVAESVATGKAPSVPYSFMAADPCPFEDTGMSENTPVPFVPTVPTRGNATARKRGAR